MIEMAKDQPRIGARIVIDLSRPIVDADRQRLIALFERESLLVFADQALTLERQHEVCSWFGPILRERIASGYVAVDSEKGGLGAGALAFHQDLMCTDQPYLGVSLHAIEIGGSQQTCFIDARAACAQLPSELRQQIDGRTARHVWPRDIGSRDDMARMPSDWPGVSHPIVMRHPRLDYDMLCVTEQQTHSIDDLDRDESDRLLQALFDHLRQPQFRYDHDWREGDFLLWDNIALQHGRRAIDGSRRTLQRVCLAESSGETSMPAAVRDFYLGGAG